MKIASRMSAEGAPFYSRGPLRPAENKRVRKECRRYSPLFRGQSRNRSDWESMRRYNVAYEGGQKPTAEGCNPLDIRGYLRHPHPLTCIPGVRTPGYQWGAPSALFSLCATWLLCETHFDTPSDCLRNSMKLILTRLLLTYSLASIEPFMCKYNKKATRID